MDRYNDIENKGTWSTDFTNFLPSGSDVCVDEGEMKWLLYYNHAKFNNFDLPKKTRFSGMIVGKSDSDSEGVSLWAKVNDDFNYPYFNPFAIEGLLWQSVTSGVVVKSLGAMHGKLFRGEVLFDIMTSHKIVGDVYDTWYSPRFIPITKEKFAKAWG